MAEKVKIINDAATFMCPECLRARTVDASKYKKENTEIAVKCKCPCGHEFSVILERRQCGRKPTSLNGIYVRFENGKEIAREIMTITELSCSGIKFKLLKRRDFNIGERVQVVFKLEDTQKTVIKNEVTVRTVNDIFIGAEFRKKDQSEAIGSFLNEIDNDKEHDFKFLSN